LILLTFFIFYFLLIYLIFRKEPLVIVIFFFPILKQTTNYISVFYLDHGDIYMREIQSYSEKSYTSILLWFFNVTALFVIYFLIRITKQDLYKLLSRLYTLKIRYIKSWIFLFYFIIGILILNILISGSPLWISSINKTTFWTIAKLQFLKPVSSQISIIALFSGMFLLYINLHNKKSSLLKGALYGVWIFLLVYLILMGHKFGQLLIITYMFFLPLLLYMSLIKKFPAKKIFFIFSCIIAFFSLFVINYFKTKYGDAAFDIIQQRIFSMEGQLTYTAIQNYLQNQLPNGLEQLVIEIKYILGLIHNNTVIGMDYLMDRTMPDNLLEAYRETQVKLAQGYLAMLFYLFNNFFIVLFVHMVFILLYGFIGYLLLRSILKYDFILTFFYAKIYFSFLAYYAQAYTTAIFNLKTLIYFFCIILIHIIRQIYKKKRMIYCANTSYN